MTIGFPKRAPRWGVVTGTVASVSGGEIRIDRGIEEGNSGGPLLMNGRVVGMVTTTAGFGVAKPAIFVQATLRGWDVEIPPPARGPGHAGTPVSWANGRGRQTARWSSAWTTARRSRAAAIRRGAHEFAGVYQADDWVRPDHHPHRSRSVQDDRPRIHQD